MRTAAATIDLPKPGPRAAISTSLDLSVPLPGRRVQLRRAGRSGAPQVDPTVQGFFAVAFAGGGFGIQKPGSFCRTSAGT